MTGVQTCALPIYPFVAGADNTLFDWSTAPTGDAAPAGDAPKGVYLPKNDGTGNPVAGVNVVATFDGKPLLMDIPAGTNFDAGQPVGKGPFGIAGERRVMFADWGYDQADPLGQKTYQFDSFTTAAYKTVLTNILGELAPVEVPEPSSVTLLVCGLLGLAVYGWRRRS